MGVDFVRVDLVGLTHYVYSIFLRVRSLHAAASRSSMLTTRFYSLMMCSSLAL